MNLPIFNEEKAGKNINSQVILTAKIYGDYNEETSFACLSR